MLVTQAPQPSRAEAALSDLYCLDRDAFSPARRAANGPLSVYTTRLRWVLHAFDQPGRDYPQLDVGVL